jgi:hypothetical protein
MFASAWLHSVVEAQESVYAAVLVQFHRSLGATIWVAHRNLVESQFELALVRMHGSASACRHSSARASEQAQVEPPWTSFAKKRHGVVVRADAAGHPAIAKPPGIEERERKYRRCERFRLG